MIRFCRHYYRDNPFELEKIDDFEQNYRLENILRWYTQECFVYKMINKALRSEDLEQLLRFSFLIAALSKRLADGQNNPRRKMPSTITVYRGVRLHRTEVDRLMKSVNLLICNQGFWSSSLRRGRALAFAKSYAATDEICPVLFEISCDTRNVYHALNNYDTALQHYRKALQLHNDYPSENLREKAICLNHIGSTEIEQGNYSAARDAFQQAFQIRQQILPPDHPHIAESLYNIGIVQRQQGDYHDALDSCRRALAIRQKLFSDDHPLVADTFELKAKIYHSQNRFQDALEIHRKVLHIREKSSPNTHADIAQSLNNI
ncbi:unnamed protein product, partial [Rotaria sp. Silwood1]